MCEQCQQLLEDYRAINEEIKAVVQKLDDVSRSREIDVYNKLWQRWLEFGERSQKVRVLLLGHLKSHAP
jgi:hypothetical protein